MHNHDRAVSNPQETSKWDILLAEQKKTEIPAEQPFDPEVFSPDQCRAVMDAIAAPTDYPDGIDRVMSSLKTKHELRILADMSGAGFDNWDRLHSDDLEKFISAFPSPADFEDTSNDFLDTIGRLNGPQKLAQYQQAMGDFRHKVYGAKQAYWEQMQAMDAISDRLPGASSSDYAQHSFEKNYEWRPGLAGVSQVSKSEVVHGDNLEDINRSPNQDSFLARQDEQTFAVFDGAGGHSGGHAASQAVANALDQACDKYNLKSGADLAYVLNSANQSVREATNGQGYTTATVAKIIEQDGRKLLAYASVGDSRLYIVHSDGLTQQITRDEGVGHRLFNALGGEKNNCTEQYGEIAISPGDKVVLCTDGVTGDYGDDLMDETELGDIVNHSQTPDEAAANLVATARKTDDRTALVFGI